jgi:hypothetical protein
MDSLSLSTTASEPSADRWKFERFLIRLLDKQSGEKPMGWKRGWLAGVGVAAALLATPAAAGFGDDRAEIEDLQGKYMFAMDRRDAKTYSETFTEDGVLDWARGVVTGRKAIYDEVVKMKATDDERLKANPLPAGRTLPPRPRHMITNMTVTITGDRAVGRAYWMSVTNAEDQSKAVVNGYGHYEDELRRVNGKWLFTKRKIFNELLKGREAVY